MAAQQPRVVTLEIRRHAERAMPDDAQGALSSVGLARARALRRDERFALVVSSPRDRAKETAAAIAGRVDETAAMLDLAGDDVLSQAQFDTLRTQDDVMRFLSSNPAARSFAEAQIEAWGALARRLPEGGSGLVVTHGGNIELAATLLAHQMGARLGRMPMGYREGLRVHYLRGHVVGLERLAGDPEPHRPPAPRPAGRRPASIRCR